MWELSKLKKTPLETLLDIPFCYFRCKSWVIESRLGAKRRLRRIGGGLKISSKEYKNQIRPFWAKYGLCPSKYWFSLYCAPSGKLNPLYIPDDIYYSKIIPYFNRLNFRRPYVDKGFYDVLFPELKQPSLLVKNMGGYYYNSSFQMISRQEVETLLGQCDSFVMKPSIDSGSGRAIFFYDSKTESRDVVKEKLDEYEKDFVVQEVVPQHSVLSAIHENSLNTVRIISFLFKGQVYILSSILRMGAGGSRLDNVSAGGFACPVYPDGQLYDKAVNRKSEWVAKHSNGTVFAEVRIPFYDRLIETLKSAHKKLPYFGIIGWDFSISPEGEPVMIEFNVVPGMNQISCGPTFGDITAEVLSTVFRYK
ncbi:sugar-transfer associated ATP-grasp domain-containing protein [Butyricimonas hominis]|jgi:hypothetical protein|uniref:Hexapeptide transferase n=1 Tax=Butyricimonas hominis TaxID=2763032 RepID=A0ABR7D3C0_9BACT|nr:sugar-transfer associated ATP-grasp domain-containing protein [Butyricimonas hominis]MBC5622419.1 hexapeptide transferase [Butyricimonas hominis]